jgi:acetyl-CoA carboxylase biotin carboxyl carrier protein
MTDGDGQQAGPLDAESVQLVMREVRDLMRSLEGTATSRVRIKAGSLEVEVERAGGVVTAFAPAAGGSVAAGAPAGAPAVPGTMPIVAPLVGVFYRAPSPGAKHFVEVGDTVERGQTVGIVEAMKVMNEVTSDFRGRVVEILVENGEAVQYEQRLILVDTGGS